MAEQITRLEFAQEQQDGRLMEHRMENLFFRWKMLGQLKKLRVYDQVDPNDDRALKLVQEMTFALNNSVSERVRSSIAQTMDKFEKQKQALQTYQV